MAQIVEQIKDYDDFTKALISAGFSMGGGNNEGIYSIIPWSWKELPPYETSVKWHTGISDTDPWEWRIRVLDERKDIAYGKLFCKKSGYITEEWYPYFLALRRGNTIFSEDYADGKTSNMAKRIYEVIDEYEVLPVHGLKTLLGVGKEEKSAFDKALVELQENMYLTMCGKQQKLSQKGEEYGWSSTVFCKVETFWREEMFKKAEKIDPDEAYEKIREQILKLNPEASERQIKRFIARR